MSRTILLADDHPLFRAALRGALAARAGDAEFVESDSVASLLEAIEACPHADLLLLDLDMPGAHGFSALAHVRGLRPELPVVVVSASSDPGTIASALAYGAQGFISKSADAGTLAADVEAVLQGEIVTPSGCQVSEAAGREAAGLEVAAQLAELTPQQFRVLSLMLSGRLNKQIAFELDISEATVKAHVTAVLRKLGVNSRTQAVLKVGHLAVDHSAYRAAAGDDD